MRDRPYLDEHSDLVTAGLLAEDVVFAVAAIREPRPLSDSERTALDSARTLLAYISAPQVRHGGEGISQLTGSTGALEALKAIESQAPGRDVEGFVRELILVLDRALAGDDVSSEDPRLEVLQHLFAGLGDVALARANSLAVGREDRLLWPSATTTSAS